MGTGPIFLWQAQIPRVIAGNIFIVIGIGVLVLGYCCIGVGPSKVTNNT